MKRHFLTIALLVTVVPLCRSQQISIEDQADKARLDLAVPDAPAFKLLETNPTTIMRPSSMREAAILIKDFALSGGVIPKGFAAELSPYSLIKGESVSLKEYRDLRGLYQTRVSVGTEQLSDGSNNLAAGLRISLSDASDLRSNDSLIDKMTRALDAMVRAAAEFKKGGLQKKLGAIYFDRLGASEKADLEYRIDSLCQAGVGDIDRRFQPGSEAYRRFREGIKEKFLDSLGWQFYRSGKSLPGPPVDIDSLIVAPGSPVYEIKRGADMLIRDARENAITNNWNAPVLDAGFAMLATSADSLYKSLRSMKYGIWLIWAHPLFGNAGQFLLGVKGLWRRDAADAFKSFEGSYAGRVYLGTNNYKGFLEIDIASSPDKKPAYNASLGGELHIANGIWADASVGIRKQLDAAAEIKSSLNLRFATPQLNL